MYYILIVFLYVFKKKELKYVCAVRIVRDSWFALSLVFPFLCFLRFSIPLLSPLLVIPSTLGLVIMSGFLDRDSSPEPRLPAIITATCVIRKSGEELGCSSSTFVVIGFDVPTHKPSVLSVDKKGEDPPPSHTHPHTHTHFKGEEERGARGSNDDWYQQCLWSLLW